MKKNRTLFEQLADVAEASYSSTLGKTRQQDIVRAQLELTRLEDRLDVLGQQQNRFEGMLSQWLTEFSIEKSSQSETYVDDDFNLHNIVLTKQLPQIDLVNSNIVLTDSWLRPSELAKYIANHPSLVAVEKKIKCKRLANHT